MGDICGDLMSCEVCGCEEDTINKIWHYMKESENSKYIIITKKKECDSLVMGLRRRISFKQFNHMMTDVIAAFACRAEKTQLLL